MNISEIPLILALETATSSCSAALRVDDRVLRRSEQGNNIHSKVLLNMVRELFAEAALSVHQLDAVAVGQGPGSFTGLRIGVGVGQGIAYGAGCPMIGISSLDALALQTDLSGTVVASIDARMREVYWCAYDKRDDVIERQTPLQVSPPSEIEIASGSYLVGNAWSAYWDQFSSTLKAGSVHLPDVLFPDAGVLLKLAERKYRNKGWVNPTEFAPIYVRDNVAKKSVLPSN